MDSTPSLLHERAPSPLFAAFSSATLRRRLAVFFKISGIALLILALHIPLFMAQGVLRERRGYQAQATQEIASVWGGRQTVTGPVLAVPFDYRGTVTRQRVVGEKVAQVQENALLSSIVYFLPERLAIEGRVDPEVRRRGIYETVVYATTLRLSGTFRPEIAAELKAEQIHWDRAQVLLGVSDLRGLRSLSPWRGADGVEAAFEATELAGPALPIGAKAVGAAPGATMAFQLELALQGSERVELTPVGKTTAVTLNSAWADPSFVGAYLPVSRTVAPEGFKAVWETAHFSRGFPQSWTGDKIAPADMLQRIGHSSFGVEFQQPMDGYRFVERAQKYGVLFFVLVFAVFFLFEVTAGLRIHPLQYAIVGAALCLFFLGFLALSEFMETGWAYAGAAGACTLMVSLYAWSFLRTGARTLTIGGGLGATYAYLYFVLQSQDYALLAGTAALFAALALVMFCTRRLNWYNLELGSSAHAEK